MNFSPSSTKPTAGCGVENSTPGVATAPACGDITDFLQTEPMAIIATTSPEIKALNLHLCHHQHQSDNNINYNYYESSSSHPNQINLFPLSPPSGLVKVTAEAEKEGEDNRPILNLHDDNDKENYFQKEETTEDVTELLNKQTVYDDDDDSLLSSSLNVLGLHATNRSHLPPPPPPTSSLSSSSGFHESSMTGMSIDLIGSPPSSTINGVRRSKSDGHHTRVSSKRKPVHRRVSYDSLPSPKEIVENDNVMAVVTPTFATAMDSLNDSNENDLRSSTRTTTKNPLKPYNHNNTRALCRGDFYSSPHGHEGEPAAAAAATTRFSGSGPLFFPVDL